MIHRKTFCRSRILVHLLLQSGHAVQRQRWINIYKRRRQEVQKVQAVQGQRDPFKYEGQSLLHKMRQLRRLTAVLDRAEATDPSLSYVAHPADIREETRTLLTVRRGMGSWDVERACMWQLSRNRGDFQPCPGCQPDLANIWLALFAEASTSRV